MKSVRLALDWTPNINHIGFIVAKEKKFYLENELDVQFLTPDIDNYTTTPAKKVENSESEFGLCPTESLISYQTKEKPFILKGLMSIYQDDVSAIATIKSKYITRPKHLDGKTYASYKARYEDEIVKKMIINDGGKGEIDLQYPERLGVWNTLVDKKYDSTWIFINWEGVEANQKKISLQLFKMKDFGIPYSYSPVLFSSENYINNNNDTIKKFVECSKRGFLFCYDNIKESTEILKKYLPNSDRKIDTINALKISKEFYGSKKTFGKINLKEIQVFLSWLEKNDIEKIILKPSDLISKYAY